jgi:hypothetical protein
MVEKSMPEFPIRHGGTTSDDVTRPGIDKAYGIRKLDDLVGVGLDEIRFVGDALFPGGNEYPVEEAGVASIKARDPEATKRAIEALIACGETRPGAQPGEGASIARRMAAARSASR